MASRISSAVEPAAVEPPEQAVLRIAPRGLGGDRRPARLPVGAAQQDQPVDRLEPPAVLDERRRQPVEQFGMAGTVALGAEVVDRLHQPRAEVVLPEPVDDHPGRQRMRRARRASGPAGCGDRPRRRAARAGRRATSTLGGRGPTGSPLFSQTPRFRTWIGVRWLEVVPDGRDRRPGGGGHRVLERLDLRGQPRLLGPGGLA